MQATKSAAVLTALALAAAGCGDDEGGDVADQPQTEPEQTQTDQTETQDTTDDGGDGEQTITVDDQRINLHDRREVSGQGPTQVELDNFYFEPSVLAGPGGQEVRLRLTNDSSAPHTFTLRGQDVDETVSPGQSATVTVTLPQSGQTVFVCRFHAGQGMRGALDARGGGEPGADDSDDDRGGGGDDNGGDDSGGDSGGSDDDGRY